MLGTETDYNEEFEPIALVIRQYYDSGYTHFHNVNQDNFINDMAIALAKFGGWNDKPLDKDRFIKIAKGE